MPESSRMIRSAATRSASFLLGWIGLLAVMVLFAGCGESHSQQQAQSGAKTLPRDTSPWTTAVSTSLSGSHATSEEKKLGLNNTWKPGEHAASVVPPRPLARPVAAKSTATDDNRYAEVLLSAPVGAPSASAGASDPSQSDNPLRTEPPATFGRPQAAPAGQAPSPSGDPAPAIAPTQPPAPPHGESKSELTIPSKPDATPAVPSTAPQPPEHTAGTVPPGPRTNKNSGVPFDPIRENGPIFLDMPGKTPWPPPKLALVITGQQEGYLEPCGCAGLERMKGGMSRRYSLFKMLRDKGWPVVGMDVGGTAKGFGKQAEIKFQIAVNGMNAMRYSSAALGLSDLKLPTEEVLSQVMPAAANAKTMSVCGNVGLFAFDEKMLPRTQLINTGFKVIGVTSVLGNTYQQKLAGNSNLKMASAEKLLDEAVPMLKKRAGYLVLLAHSTHGEAIALGKKYPDFNLVVCSDGGAEPPAQAEEINKGGTKLIEVGEKGMYAIVIGLYDDPDRPMRYQRVTLDSRFKSSPEMVALMGAYQDQLQQMGLSGLGIHPQPHPDANTNGKYVGSDACQNCHPKSFQVWKKTPHSQAFGVLLKATPPREFDPECISCHVVGWNPQKFYPYESGYLSRKETPKLINVGCEDCHGPGERHVWAENHGTPDQQLGFRKSVRLTEAEAANPNSPRQNCFSCHDLDNSPEFKFNLYFPFIKHYERE
jgi:hypothetical protein